ncbi:regulator [Streptomyces sp. Ru73]|uniref:ATP-binding protein n=1 Tax=Streptomyces sp. Ru73 TaxID=2080748 RepID=UPI000CDE0ABB|nr:NB-ARC domain-containing protein [Streptomyces sp. Ru73]POX42726.1 regulator [Streptomyces sp. Ru73]
MRGYLPEEHSSFVGRESELTLLQDLLKARRLTTITGLGGVGKSRLALRAARQAAGEYPDGVWWADLSMLQTDRLLVNAVADAVDLSDHTPRMPIDALCEWLAGKRLLLVLDGCEHLLGACTALAADLLTTVPDLTLLATSRQAMRIRAEEVLSLAPLAADGADALRLFTERMTDGGRPLQPHEEAVAADICHRLEGIPLALELAAAQVPQHGLAGVTAKLASRFEALDGSDHAWPPRQQALRTTVGWSHELCRPLERLLWARLSVFADGFDLAAATRVCAAGPLAEEDIAATLQALVDQSVVQRSGDRYRMLDTIREYGATWLHELGEEAEAAGRHADWCLQLAARARAEWFGARQMYWYARLAETHSDLCAAMEHLLATDPPRAVELIGSVGFFWVCCGHLHSARAYLEQALARCGTPGPHHAAALWSLGVALTLQGEYDEARRISARCTRHASRNGDADDRLDAAYLAGVLALLLGRPLEAAATVDRAQETDPAPDSGMEEPSAARLRCRLVSVFALTGTGRLAEAREMAQEMKQLCVAKGEFWTRAYLNYQLALIALLQGEPREAAGHARAMLVGKRGLGDSFGVALGLDLLAAALAAQGKGEEAAFVSGTSEAYWRATGHPQRGMPELGAMRAECERAARAAVSDQTYEAAFHQGLLGEPAQNLARALERVQG